MKNPYITNRNKKLIQSFVCYADVLGFSSSIKQSFEDNKGDQCLDNIRKSLKNAYRNIRNNNFAFNKTADFSLKVFTDNLVIGFPVKDYDFNAGEHELGRVFDILSEFQTSLAMDGFFVRGAIAFGEHYMDEQIVFGDALVEAHELEALGGPPRIVLSPKVWEIVQKQIGPYADPQKAPHFRDLLQDSDGIVFINYLDQAFSIFPDRPIFEEIFASHKSEIENNLVKFYGVPHTRQKYEWLAGYHNFILREIANKYPTIDDPDQDIEYEMASQNAQEMLKYLLNYQFTAPSRLQFN
jgi:hypothetical protein